LSEFDNPEMPTLQPWMNITKPPADRFVAVRNPYFHRVDANGRQLPYIDRVVMAVAESKLIPAKTGAGESDLQARDIQFNNYTFLKKGEKTNNYRRCLKTARAFRAVPESE
jgi:peptide/nickel transport system substrate-binding protein